MSKTSTAPTPMEMDDEPAVCNNNDNFVSVVNIDNRFYMSQSSAYQTDHLPQVPLLGVSSDPDNPTYRSNMFTIMNDIRSSLAEMPESPITNKLTQLPWDAGPLRVCDVYISKSSPNQLQFQITMNYRDMYMKAAVESGTATVDSLDIQFWNEIKTANLKDKNGNPFYDWLQQKFLEFTTILQPYIKNLIKKHILLPEILHYTKNNGVIRMQIDHYTSRMSGYKNQFGFHKDTYSCDTFRVALTFQNETPIHGSELIQCSSSMGKFESPRCNRILRFKLPPRATISFNDFLLAHSSPSCIGSKAQIPALPTHSLINTTRGWEGKDHGLISAQLRRNMTLGAVMGAAGAHDPAAVPFLGEIAPHVVMGRADDPQRGTFDTGLGKGIPATQRPEFLRVWFEIIPVEFYNKAIDAHKSAGLSPPSFIENISDLSPPQDTRVLESNNVSDAMELLLSDEFKEKRCGGKRTKQRKHKRTKHKRTKHKRTKHKRTKHKRTKQRKHKRTKQRKHKRTKHKRTKHKRTKHKRTKHKRKK
jgi:hypothetical protein